MQVVRFRFFLFLLSACLFSPVCARSEQTANLVRPQDVRQITYSNDCVENAASETPGDTLNVTLTSAGEGACTATLEFQIPQDIGSFPILRFETLSSAPGHMVAIKLLETTEGPLVSTPPLPRDGIQESPQRIRVNLRPFSKDLPSRHFSAMRFVSLPKSGTARSDISSLTIRQITFAKAPVVTPAPPPPAPVPSQAPKPHTSFHLKWFLALSGLVLMVLNIQKKSQRGRFLSPLYEINTRSWKSHRDENGVIHLGGLSNITLEDLKAIKNQGFNAVWLMGIWEIGPKVRDISKRYGPDFMGSPFAISDYRVSSDLGTEQEFHDLVQRARSLGLGIVLDFVPNHMGMDSLWLNDHPEYFIHKVLEGPEALLSNEELEKRNPGYFAYRTPAYPEGEIRVPKTILVAYGKDPYFYPWIDTAQLDFAQPGLRKKMIAVLSDWARWVDGVRCDMAMLAMREQVKVHRHPEMSWETFNTFMPNEFWTEAIAAVKHVNPQFVFIGETYWSLEGALQRLGFDYTYNKPVYEAICSAVHSGNAEGLQNFLRLLGSEFLSKCVHFLENHDEERAMNTLGDERQRPAAVILNTLPGISLFHQGQLEGRRERMPVQRVVPLHEERENESLRTFYIRLLSATGLPLFREGRLTVLYSNNTAFATYARTFRDRRALVVVNTSNQCQKGNVMLTSGLRLESGVSYRFDDLYYDLKTPEVQKREGVQRQYVYTAAKLINEGLYVELPPFDSHIFLITPLQAHSLTGQLASWWRSRQLLERPGSVLTHHWMGIFGGK